jgi:sucrose synthase
LFEAFGLTVIESMASGLPVVATRFGGPASIIEEGISGLLVDPNRAADVEKAVLAVLRGATAEGTDRWTEMSQAAMHRIREHFSWEAHARTMISAYGVYGLWNEIFPKRRAVRRTYVDALYNLLYGRLVEETWPEQ